MANNSQFTGMQPLRPRIIGGHVGPPPSPLPPMSMQFRPAVPPPPPQPFIPVTPQQFQPVGLSNMGMPPHPTPMQYPQGAPPPPPPPPPPPQRPGLAGHGPPQGPPLPPSDFQPNRPPLPPGDFQPNRPPLPPGDFQPNRPPLPPADFQPNRPVMSTNFMPNFAGPVIPPPPYPLSMSSGGQQQMNVSSISQNQSLHQTNIPNFSAGGHPWFPAGNQNLQSVIHPLQAVEQSGGGQPWFSTVNQNLKPVTPLQQTGEQNAGVQQWLPSANQNVQSGISSQQAKEQSPGMVTTTKPDHIENTSSEWRECTSHDGRKYFYNKRTRYSSWEKPLELMTLTERADASTGWKEFTTSEGITFYFNKATKQSKWTIPDEVKLARERAHMISCEGAPIIKDVDSNASAAISVSFSGIQGSNPSANNLYFSAQQMVSNPISVARTVNPEPATTSGLSILQDEVFNSKADATRLHTPLETSTLMVASDTPVPVDMDSSMTPPVRTSMNTSPQEAAPPSVSETLSVSLEEANKRAEISGSGSINAPEGKKVEHRPLVYETKEEAKNAFKALLETANVGSDWNWDQAMRVIINDRRYGALKSLGERKLAFNEFVGQKKKQEAEERRARQKKAREDFKKMLNESKDLTSSTRWSKAVSTFENDERFRAIERVKDREDLFGDHLEELKKKERAKALEEHKRHKTEYLGFLKSCDFVTANSQWRKVQHRLEADERCSRLEKFERLEIFQEYIRDLELEEDGQRKLRMEESRKTERKNRDEFRKLMDEHVATAILTAKTHWRDYCMKVKDAPAYVAVSSNTSGSTAKDLFDDIIDDLEKQYLEDKEKIEDAIKNEKISLPTNYTLEDFKNALSRAIISTSISDINLKLVHDELMERAKEKEEKEAKKRKRLAEEIYDFLFSLKEITASSKWEDCKPQVEERFLGEESFFQEIFDKVIIGLKEKAKERERRRKEEKAKKEKDRKDKERRTKDRGVESRKGKERRKKEEIDSDESESQSLEENRRSRDKNQKHRKRRMDSFDDTSFDDDDKDRSKTQRHGADTKKSKQMEKQSSTLDVDSESHSKKHKKDNWDGSNKDDNDEEYKDGDLGEDGEVQ